MRTLIAFAACAVFAGSLSAQPTPASKGQTQPTIIVNVPPQPAPTVSVSVPQQPPPTVVVKPPEDKELSEYTLALVFGSGALAVIAVLQLVVFGKQAKQLRRTVDSAESIARPIVIPRILDATQVYAPATVQPNSLGGESLAKPAPHDPRIEFTFDNYGQTPAFVRHVKWELRLLSEPLPAAPPYQKPLERPDRIVIPPNSRPESSVSITHKVKQKPSYGDILRSRMGIGGPDSKGQRFFFFGSVAYDDIFGFEHEAGFCFKIWSDGTSMMRGDKQYVYFKRRPISKDRSEPVVLDEPPPEQA